MMDTTARLSRAGEILKPFERLITHPAPDRLDVTILPSALEAAVRALNAEHWGYLVAITGVDRPGVAALVPEEKQWARVAVEQETKSADAEHEGSIELLYTFCSGAAVVTLRTSVRYSLPVVSTICNIIPAATLYERELIEMFGVEIAGTPNSEKLLLPDDWPDGVYPLRKSFKGFAQNLPAGEK
jgi:Ni,Fe-hydrogenase III component G